MGLRRITVALTSALLLAAPAPVLAQSAGDEQYADPIEEPAPPSNDSGGGGDAGSGSGSAPSAPAPPAAPAAPGTTAAPTAMAAELPRTGADTMLLALAGSALLLAGAGIRLAVPRRD